MVIEPRAGVRRRARRQMDEASAVEDLAAEWRRRLQRQGGGAELVRCLGAGTFRHSAGQTRIGEGAHLDRPIAA